MPINHGWATADFLWQLAVWYTKPQDCNRQESNIINFFPLRAKRMNTMRNRDLKQLLATWALIYVAYSGSSNKGRFRDPRCWGTMSIVGVVGQWQRGILDSVAELVTFAAILGIAEGQIRYTHGLQLRLDALDTERFWARKCIMFCFFRIFSPSNFNYCPFDQYLLSAGQDSWRIDWRTADRNESFEGRSVVAQTQQIIQGAQHHSN